MADAWERRNNRCTAASGFRNKQARDAGIYCDTYIMPLKLVEAIRLDDQENLDRLCKLLAA